jgi:hypothetical protein
MKKKKTRRARRMSKIEEEKHIKDEHENLTSITGMMCVHSHLL